MLYSFNGSYPAPLPFQIFLSDGRSRTDPGTFTEDELADAGFTGPFTMPTAQENETVTWDGKAFSTRALTAEEIAARELAARPPVPAAVTNFQARAALLKAGLFELVNDHLLGQPITSPERQAWEYANEVTRHGTLVNGVTGLLGITPEQVDDLFRQAATIEA